MQVQVTAADGEGVRRENVQEVLLCAGGICFPRAECVSGGCSPCSSARARGSLGALAVEKGFELIPAAGQGRTGPRDHAGLPASAGQTD